MILGMIWVAAAGAQEIVIGYTGPLSGPAGEYGQDCANGVEMAINEINAAGGILVKGKKHTFKLEKMDDRVNPQITVNNALQMRKEFKAIAVFNPVFGTMAALMKINQEKKNEFLVMGYTSVPQASEMGNKLTIILTMPFHIYNKVFANLAWQRGWRKGAIVVTAGAYGDAWRKVFRDEWEKKGGVITVDKATNYYTRTDFAAPLAEALASEPDFMLIGGPSATTALIIEQARAKGFEGGFVMIDQAKLDAIQAVMEKPLGLEGTLGLAKVTSISFPATENFKQQYTAAYKRDYTWESVVNYTSMHALAKAIVAAGTVDDVRAIRAAFPKAFPMLGDKYPMEVFGITQGGRMLSTPVVQTMKHGKFTQPNLYVWWANTQKEFDQVQKITKGSIPFIWHRMD
jgi:branched-chain amino acid transport system substrate-binding protein